MKTRDRVLSRLLTCVSLVFLQFISNAQCVIKVVFGQHNIPLSEVAVYVYGVDTGKVIYATITDSSGMFVIPEEICDSYDSLFITFNTMRYKHKKVKFQCCQDEINVDPSTVGFAMIDPPVQIVLLPTPYIEEFRNQAMRTGYPSAVEVPMRIQSFEPLALLSRNSGWDVNIILEGMQSKQLRAKLEGSSLYSLCPMEMGGCLAGLQSFLTENLEVKYVSPSSGSALLNFNLNSIEFNKIPYLSLDIFGQASTLGNGYEYGIKAKYSSPKWFSSSGIVRSFANSYYAGKRTLVLNSDYRNTGAMFQIARKIKSISPKLTYFLSRTTDAGYPTMPDVRILREERHVLSVSDKVYLNGLRLRYLFAYQTGIHLMEMKNQLGSKILSGGLSDIYDVSISIGKKHQFYSQATVWQMDAFLQEDDVTRPQVQNALVVDWTNYFLWRYNRGKLNIGMAYLSWKAESTPLNRYFIPVMTLDYKKYFKRKIFFKIEVEHSYRTPTPVELYREHVVLPGRKYLLSIADSLLPEKYWAIRITTTWDRNMHKFGNIEVSLQGFIRVIKDYIFLLEQPNLPSPLPNIAPTVVVYQNVGDLLLAGAGIKFVYRHNRFRSDLLAGWTWGEFLDDGSPAPYLFPLSVRGIAQYGLTQWLETRVSIEGMPSQTRINPDFGQVPSPAYVKIDFSLNGKVNNWLEFTAYVNNILDQYYFLPTSYGAVPEPGRYAGVSVKINIDKHFISKDKIIVAEYSVPMRCPTCVKSVKRILRSHTGVIRVEADYNTDIVKVWFNYTLTDEQKIETRIWSEYSKDVKLIKIYVPKEK